MRLRRLHLGRYGGFADAVLDLPPPAAPDGPDVTIVLGPNEAGKSTAFAAWLDLLFGFPPRNVPAAWHFRRAELAIAADLETPEGPLHVASTPNEGLRDADGSPILPREVAALLHGLDRDAYRTRFSLDREMLDAGGRDIADGKGELGDLLFSGIAGLTGIHGALDAVRAGAEAFHKSGGRKTALAMGRRDIATAEEALRTRLTPEAQAELDARVAEAEARMTGTEAALERARRDVACAQDAEALREIGGALDELNARLAQLPSCTWTPDQAEAARKAQAEVARLEPERAAAAAAVEAAEAALRDLAPDPAEGVAAEVLGILEDLRSGSASVLSRLGPDNDADLGQIADRRDDRAPDIEGLRTRFDLAVPAKGLADAIEPALRGAEDAAAALARAEARTRDARGTFENLPSPDDPGDVETLRETLKALDGLDVDGLRAAHASSAEALERLGPAGGVPDLSDLPDPAHLRTELDRHRDAVRLAEAARDALREAATDRDAKRRILADLEGADLATGATATEAARHARDGAWRTHRAQLDAASADAFAEAMATHDRLVAGAAEAAARREAREAARKAAAEAEATHTARADAAREAAEERARHALAPLARRLGLPDGAAPDALPARLDVLREIARLGPAARRAADDLAEARAERARLLGRLARLCGDEDDPEGAARARLRASEAIAATAARHQIAREALQTALREEDEARAAADEAARLAGQERAALGLGPVAVADLPDLRHLATLEADDARDAERMDALGAARGAAAPHLARLLALGAPEEDPIGWARTRQAADARAAQSRDTARAARNQAAEDLEALDRAYAEALAARDAALDGEGGAEIADPAARIDALSAAAAAHAEIRAHDRTIHTLEGRHAPGALAALRAEPD
ncbi:MAG: AAA family ATPase, partial [Shimia sp.]